MRSSPLCITSRYEFSNDSEDCRSPDAPFHDHGRPCLANSTLFCAVFIALLGGGGARAFEVANQSNDRQERTRHNVAALSHDAVCEADPTARIEKLLALRSAIASAARGSPERFRSRDELSLLVVDATYIAFLNNDHSRGRGGVGGMPSQVTEMPGRVPMEIVALRIATPAHWVTVLYPHLVQGSSLAGQMIEAAGGFDTDEFVYGRFRHVGSVLNPKSRERICSTGEYDGLMHAMLSRNRLAAATQLLELDQWPLEGEEKVQTFLKLRRDMAELQMHYEHLAALRRNSLGDAPFPYDSRAAELALALAHRGEWPVHLFLMSFMTPRSQWHDRAVVERIAAHKNPVSLRFLDKRGLALTESTHMKS